MLARFVDELLSGAWTVLAPTFRRTFGLSLVAVALLDQVLFWVALVVEPPAALLIDVKSRRAIMTFGAAWIGLGSIAMGVAPTYAFLLAGFAAYGIGSGPLADSADIILVESHPDHAEQAFARGTFVDTIGALLAPALIALAAWTGVSWRVVLVGLGLATLVYAWAVAATPMPRAGTRAREGEVHLVRELWGNLREVLRDRGARRWLLFGLWFDVLEAPHALKYVWLHEHVGLDQAAVAAYAVGEHVVGLISLMMLDHGLARFGSRRVIIGVSLGLLLVFPAWVAAPGIAARIGLGIPLAFLHALLWPISRTRTLVSVPGRAGAVTAVNNLLSVLPFAIGFGALAEWIGLTQAMLVAAVVGGTLLVVTAAGDPEDAGSG